jgi:DNA-binding phage protein
LDSIRNVITRRYDAIKPQIKESIAERRKNAADYLRDALKTSDPEMRAEYLQSYKNLTASVKDLSSFLSTGKLNPTVIEEGKLYDIKPNIQYDNYKDSFSISKIA